ncbi:hypothetical protein STCU_11533 [Strigomonas culicis]|uniref:Uncharacterized protein n=1 Tax=Strigomonas culicis TaxID=28005 RepID=S9TGW8_9TRYP|nr:hypothetical protein STCU_11533 [Strigomonas culicis]|eukprot:EPY16134.1 hypothetical protein STCU_11533 [Strigomonas culicis]
MSSKYDVVKVQVVVQDDHYYFLSRFLLSKMLMFAKVPPTTAVQISLDLKRSLVVRGKTAISQEEMEQELYSLMAVYGFGRNNVHLFPLMKNFFAARVSLIVLLAGSLHCLKSSIAKQLALVLNCCSLVNVETLLGIVQTLTAFNESEGAHPASACGAERTSAENAWLARCRCVKLAVESEVDRSIAQGKSLIIEGEALNFTLYKAYLTPQFQKDHRVIVVPLLLHRPPLQVPTSSHSSESGVVEKASRTIMDTERLLFSAHLHQLAEHRVCVASLSKRNPETIVADDSGACWDISFTHPEQLPVVVSEIHDVVIDRILKVLQVSS